MMKTGDEWRCEGKTGKKTDVHQQLTFPEFPDEACMGYLLLLLFV